MSWLGAQGLVVVLWLGSEWAVRHGGWTSNRVLRWALLASAVLVFVPLPAMPVDRLVPTMSGSVEGPFPAMAVAIEQTVSPVKEELALLPWLLGVAVVFVLLLQIAGWASRLRGARVVRQIGRVRIAIQGDAPCTVWMGRPWVLVDAATWADPDARDLAIRHELAHLRHHDPQFAWVLALFVAVCALNPFAWLFARRMAELDELAVDRAVLKRGASPRAYGQLLLAVSSRAPSPTLAAGLVPRRSFLHRRLSMFSSRRSSRRVPWVVLALALTAVAWAGPRTPSGDLPELARAASNEDLVVPAHPKVAEALDRLQGPRGAAFVKRALDRRPEHRDAIREALEAAGMPSQLEAVAFIESGFQADLSTGDLDSAAPAGGPIGAGLWMFIPATARTYGLRVDKTVDERLDPKLETEAAIALLADMHDLFGDWGLALAAYNQGPGAVQRAIRTEGTRDALELAEAGALNHYVATVYAGMGLLAEADR